MAKVPLKAILKELERRNIRFGEEFPDNGIFIDKEGVRYAVNVADRFDGLFKEAFFDSGKSKDYAFIINEGIKSTNPKIRKSCESIKSKINSCIDIAKQLKTYIDVKYQKAIQDWGKKWNKKFSTTPKRNYSFALDESEYRRKALQYISSVNKTFHKVGMNADANWAYIVNDGRKCQDSRIREMCEKIFRLYGAAEAIWEYTLKGMLEK